MRFGLSEQTITQIQAVLARCPQVETAVLYGSRAKGTQRPGSDIDLTLHGQSLTFAHLLRLMNDLDDLLLPYTIDLSLFQTIANPDLIDHIERAGIIFYQKNDKQPVAQTDLSAQPSKDS